MPRDVISLLEAGNKAQLEKLKENNHKEGFHDQDLLYLYKRITEERIELGEELYYEKQGQSFFEAKFKDDRNLKDIRREFADIANFCHMGILACDKEIKKG